MEVYCRKCPIGLTAYLLLDALEVLAVDTWRSYTDCAGPLSSILSSGAILVQAPSLSSAFHYKSSIVGTFSSYSTLENPNVAGCTGEASSQNRDVSGLLG